jgi:CubicO group peptidase (beta-lactamase class C family)
VTSNATHLAISCSNGAWCVLDTATNLPGEWAFQQTCLVETSNRLDMVVSEPSACRSRFFRARGPASPTDEETARYSNAAVYSESVGGDALLVMRDGVVVFEHYTGATTTNTLHMLASGTKSFSAALFALGAADGLWSLEEPVTNAITEWCNDTNRWPICIRHLLSLTSGLVDSTNYSAGHVPDLDTYGLAINESTQAYPPDYACIYAPCNFQVLAAIFERKTGHDPVLYLYEKLLSALGFSTNGLLLWTRDKLGKPQMAGGAYFTAREWARYGKLWLQNGAWQGRQLLDPEIVAQAVTCSNSAFLGYGLTWWLNRPTAGTYNPGVDIIPADGRGDGDQIATNAPADMYMAAGTGKQRLYVIPSLRLVVVRYGHALASPGWSDHELLGKLLGVP